MSDVVIAVGSVLAMTIGLVIWMLTRERRRSRRLAEVAQAMRFAFEPDGRDRLPDRLGDLPLLALGPLSRWFSISNLLRGTVAGRRVIVCDYHFATGDVEHRQDHYYTVAAQWVDRGTLPDFSLRPRPGSLSRRVLDPNMSLLRMAARLSRHGALVRDALTARLTEEIRIDAPSEFMQRYQMYGPDAAAIRNSFRPAVLADLMGHLRPLSLDCRDGWFAVYRSPYVPPRELKSFVEYVGRLVERLRQG